MHHAVREDRLWFQSNPVALVRFRTASPGEFTPLLTRWVNSPHASGRACVQTQCPPALGGRY